MVEHPIACSLSAGDYRARLSAIRELGRRALVEVDETPDGAVLSFRESEKVRNDLSVIVEAEGECCSFLGLSIESNEERLSLTISAPSEAMPIVRDLIESFQGTKADL
jgi:hypothetical protein